MSSGARHDVLISLLIELFEVDELRRFIEKLDDGQALLTELPGSGVSRIAFACEVVRSLQRRGEIGLSLFAALEIERPKQQELIRGVALQVLVPPSRGASSGIISGGYKQRNRSGFKVVHVVGAVLGLAILLCVGLSFTDVARRTAALRVEACKVRCEDCAGMTRAWITVDDGQTTVVEINGQEISFDCLAAGTKASVVLQVRDGQTKMRFIHVEMVARSEPVEIPLSEFSEGIPDGFVPETAVRQWDAVKKRTPSRRVSPPSPSVNPPTLTVKSPLTEESSKPSSPSLTDSSSLVEDSSQVGPPMQSVTKAPTASPQRTMENDHASLTLKRKPDINCEGNRQRVNEAIELMQWKRVLKLTDSVCWENDPRKIDLRSRAFFELGLFGECIAVGDGSTDETIVRRARACAKRLEWKKDADERLRRVAGEDIPPTSEPPAL